MKTKFLLFKFCALTMAITLLFSTGAFAASGTLDSTFGVNGIVIADLGSASDSGSGVAVQSDGGIFLLGSAQLNPANLNDLTKIISRYNSNGTVDNSYGVGGRIFPGTQSIPGSKIAVQSDGKLIVAGSSNGSIVVARYNSNGTSLDTAFGTNGIVIASDSGGFHRYGCSDLAIQPDGKIVVVGTETNAGNFTNIVILRLNSDGTRYDTDFFNGLIILDKTNFPNNRYNSGEAVAIQADGKIVITGDMMDDDAKIQISLARLNPNSSLDTSTFGTNGKGTVTVPLPYFRHSRGALAIQADGKIIVVGTIVNNDNTVEDLALARFNSNGALDTTFGETGIVVTDFGAKEYGADVHPQSDGRIIVVGTSTTGDSSRLLVVRYNKNGSLDNTFGNNGKLIGDPGTSGAEIEIQSDGKMLVAGSSNGDAALSRYDVSSPVVKTFKSVGAHDGWILESTELSNSGGTLSKFATTFNLGDDLRDRQYRSVLSFNTASIPDTAIITSARLKFKRQGLVGTDPFSTHDQLYLNISKRAFSNNLALQAEDFSAKVGAGSTQDQITAETFNWYAANLSGTNLGFISKTGVTQFRLGFSKDDNDDRSADYMRFFSGNSTDANMPKLIITYYVP